MKLNCAHCGETHASLSEIAKCAVEQDRLLDQQIIEERGYAVGDQVDAPKRVRKPGMYLNGDILYQVVEGETGNLYAKRLMIPPEDSDESTYFVFERGAMPSLTADMEITKEMAVEFGHRFHVCAVCGTRIEAEESLRIGIGPVCRAKKGW